VQRLSLERAWAVFGQTNITQTKIRCGVVEITENNMTPEMLEKLKALTLITAANEIEDSADESGSIFDPQLAANLLRFQRVTQRTVDKAVVEHASSINSKLDMMKAIEAYDRSYLRNLELPYYGIAAVAQELINAAARFKMTSPQVWLDFAKGRFDWNKDMDDMMRITF
jgi:hypothetical protein